MPPLQHQTRTFSRQEFYDRVWLISVTKFAAELGCTSATINRVCESSNIPRPYAGYWVKIAHGKSPAPTPLPDDPDAESRPIVFYQYDGYETTVDEPPRELQYDDDILELLQRAKSLGPVKVLEKLSKPHPLVLATKDRIDLDVAAAKLPWSQRNSAWREKAPHGVTVEVSAPQVKRALRIMDALLKRVEQVGGKVEIHSKPYQDYHKQTVVKFGGDEVTVLRIREKHNQVRKKNEDTKYSWERDRTELVPTGLLLIDEGPSGYGKPFLADGKSTKLEDGLDALVVALVRTAGENRIRRREREAAERKKLQAERVRREREAELKRLRDELAQRQREEHARVEQLIQHAEAMRRSRLVREYLDELFWLRAPDGVVDIDSTLAEYLRWGFQQADRLDPLRPSPPSVLDERIEDAEELQELDRKRRSLPFGM